MSDQLCGHWYLKACGVEAEVNISCCFSMRVINNILRLGFSKRKSSESTVNHFQLQRTEIQEWHHGGCEWHAAIWEQRPLYHPEWGGVGWNCLCSSSIDDAWGILQIIFVFLWYFNNRVQILGHGWRVFQDCWWHLSDSIRSHRDGFWDSRSTVWRKVLQSHWVHASFEYLGHPVGVGKKQKVMLK